MQGTISSRDLLVHGFTIVRHFGLPTYWRCLRACFSRRSCTFLDVVYEEDEPSAQQPQA